jgi:aldehyde dehydrogenase (NAD+)
MTSISDLFISLEYGPAPESATSAEAWLEAHDRRFGHFIGGDFVGADAGESFAVHRPATAGVIAHVAQGDEASVDAAVRAARKALPKWEKLGPAGRAEHIYALARGIQRRARLFATLESIDNGKPIRESRDLDVPLVARHFYHHAGWAQLRDTTHPGRTGVGVVGQVIPWNFPLLMLSWKVAPALAAGCTIVLKPAEYTPLTALLFAELCREVGLPDGVFNLVNGDGRTGAALVAHPDVDKVAFTGSTEVGRELRRVTAGTGKRLSLELGGKSPFVVFEDADLDAVVEGVVDAIWFNQGQVCCAGSRILVQEGIEERLLEKLRARMETLRVGDPLDKAVDMGAIVDRVQLDRIREMIADGAREGATVWTPSSSMPEEGWFHPPTVCTDVDPGSALWREEIFGPVVVMRSFRTPAEAVQLANDTRYGLAASIWTENLNVALDVAPKVKAGTVWVNCTNLFDAASGFGGYRESGFGREGGEEGFEEYLAHRSSGARQAIGPDEDAVPTESAVGAPVAGIAGSGEAIDRTVKLYVGGRQSRPDAEYLLRVNALDGAPIGEVPRGTRKDVRNAVEAARKAASGWAGRTAHNRAQILYYLAENLAQREEEIAARLARWSGKKRQAKAEVAAARRILFSYAAWADKWDGRVHSTPFRNVTLAMREPIGVVGVFAPREAPFAGLAATLGPLLALGNTVVAIPSTANPLPAADWIQLFETSDIPAGVVNVVTGLRADVAPTLADHDDVDALWCFGTREEGAEIERRSADNLKRTWCALGEGREWLEADHEAERFLREAAQIKNIWVPYGA